MSPSGNIQIRRTYGKLTLYIKVKDQTLGKKIVNHTWPNNSNTTREDLNRMHQIQKWKRRWAVATRIMEHTKSTMNRENAVCKMQTNVIEKTHDIENSEKCTPGENRKTYWIQKDTTNDVQRKSQFYRACLTRSGLKSLMTINKISAFQKIQDGVYRLSLECPGTEPPTLGPTGHLLFGSLGWKI